MQRKGKKRESNEIIHYTTVNFAISFTATLSHSLSRYPTYLDSMYLQALVTDTVIQFPAPGKPRLLKFFFDPSPTTLALSPVFPKPLRTFFSFFSLPSFLFLV
jgi:hypothetical protein